MKNVRLLCIYVVILLSLTLSCGEDDGNIITPDPGSPGEFITVDVQVDIPSGVDLDLSTTEVFSLFQNHTVSVDGLAKSTYSKGGRSIAMLLDSAEQILLMGFITDSKRELSIASTVEVSLFLRLGTIFLPEQVKEKFVNEAYSLPGFNEFIAQADSLFKTNKNFLDGEEYYVLLQNYVDNLTYVEDISGVRISFTSDIRSGVQLEEQAGDAIVLVNTYRRRAHAFFYKVSSKDLNGVHTNHIIDIVGSNANSQSDVIVGPTFAVTGFIGALQNQASGKGIEVARKESNPTILKLLDNENEAKYKVRVIGPSPIPSELTNQEDARLLKLYIETLGFDFALPVLLAMISEDSFLEDFKESDWKLFFNVFESSVSGLQAVNDALIEGDLEKATREFKDAFVDASTSGIFEDLFEAVIDNITQLNGGFSQENSQLILARSRSFFNALKVVDKALQVADFARIYDGYNSSVTMEQWEVDVTRNKVEIQPRDTWAVQGEEKTFKATIQDISLAEGQSFEYRWRTTGNYGELRSANASGDSVVSSSNQIAYFSSNSVSLPDDAYDSIMVDVYLKQGMSSTRVGDAGARVEVRPLGFNITPDSVTIDGGAQLKLYVKRTDDTNPVEDSFYDYRFVWYTSADYGLFNGSQSDISVINDNSVIYEALDKETQEGTEDVEVSIYARQKGTDDRFSFVDKVSEKIFIENDSLRESYFLDFVTIGVAPYIDGNYCNWGVQNAVYLQPFVPPSDLEVVNYTLTIIEGWPAIIGTGATWSPSNIPNSIELRDSLQYHYGVDETADSAIVSDVYVYGIGGTGAQGGSQYCTEGTANSDYAEKIALYNTFTGKAQVVVTLRYKD